ncbi:uncharacterized protein LOC115740199 [Rhodamnia argentea]|uniref:Uncharacterized protein LOC115740199 n=1 Tax=Rhodamnia argentea TaxID=178133 RepID=A0ABM3HU20_9MYRT|nr:uncharacterized protein LOC115740199 [Rhodamnia argentea]XP_048140117.1 uncharacterized protein LOC115740199 [Rhodamnia argentea]
MNAELYNFAMTLIELGANVNAYHPGRKFFAIVLNAANVTWCRDSFVEIVMYIRYGEHVLEARQNSNWLCPVCRGICNCSLCRQAKGWPPTGPLYKKVSKLGFKSAAHYLIETHRLQAE